MMSTTRIALQIALLISLAVPAGAAPPLPKGTEIRVSAPGTGFSPSVAVFEDGRFVVVWNGDTGVRARFFDSQGRPTSGELDLKTGVAVALVNQVVADPDGSFLVAWTGRTLSGPVLNVYVRRFNPNGTPRGKTIRANAPSTSDRHSPVVAIGPDGRFAVAWRADVTGTIPSGDYVLTDAVARIFTAKGIPVTPEILVLEADHPSPAGDDANDAYPTSVALAPDGTLSVLARKYGICIRSFLARVPPGGNSPGSLSDLTRASCSNASNSLNESLAMGKDGSLVATWRGFEAEAQRFSPSGAPRGESFLISQESADAQVDPAVALQAGGSFVIVWTETEGRDGDGKGIFGRAFDPQGRPRTRDFRINVTTAGDQFDPAIAAARRGPVVVVWSGPGGVFARVLSAKP